MGSCSFYSLRLTVPGFIISSSAALKKAKNSVDSLSEAKFVSYTPRVTPNLSIWKYPPGFLAGPTYLTPTFVIAN